MVIANLIINILIAALLVVTIGYCWLLNRRIKILQDSRSELASLLKHFDESTQRASESIIALQTASKKIGENIQFRIDKANYLMDDLSFMIEKGNKLANQIEAGFAVNRARDRAISDQQPVSNTVVAEPKEAARAPLQAHPRIQDRLEAVRGKASASLESVLEKVVGRTKGEESVADKQQEARAQAKRNRSRSEQELLDLIKVGIKG